MGFKPRRKPFPRSMGEQYDAESRSAVVKLQSANADLAAELLTTATDLKKTFQELRVARQRLARLEICNRELRHTNRMQAKKIVSLQKEAENVT